MGKTIRVKYVDGALKPMEALDMEEGAEALATLDVLPKPSADERVKRSMAAAGAWKDKEYWLEYQRQRWRERREFDVEGDDPAGDPYPCGT